MLRPALLLASALLLLSLAPPAQADIPPACDLPPRLPEGGVANAVNAVRDAASDLCHYAVDHAVDDVYEECRRTLRDCPI